MNPDFESSLGAPARAILMAALRAEVGPVVFSAPTGSGKTTSMEAPSRKKRPPAKRRQA